MSELVTATPKRGRQRKVSKAEEVGDGDVSPVATVKRKRKIAASMEEVRETRTPPNDAGDVVGSQPMPTRTKKEYEASARIVRENREGSALVSGPVQEVNENSDRQVATQKQKVTTRRKATAKSASDDVLEAMVGSGKSKDEPTRSSGKVGEVVDSSRKAKVIPKSKSTVKSPTETTPNAEIKLMSKSKAKSSSPILEAVEAAKATRQGVKNESSKGIESQLPPESEKVASSNRANQQDFEADGSRRTMQGIQATARTDEPSPKTTTLSTPSTISVPTNNPEADTTLPLPTDVPSHKPTAAPSKPLTSTLSALSSLPTSKSQSSSSTSISSSPSTSAPTDPNTSISAKATAPPRTSPTPPKPKSSSPPIPVSYSPPDPKTTPSLAPAARARAPLPPLPNPSSPPLPIDIRKTPRFKNLSWRWTSGIVGLSVLIGTSYELYSRTFVDPERGTRERPGRNKVLESGLPGVDRRREGGGGAKPRVLEEGGTAEVGASLDGRGGGGGVVEEMKVRRNGNGNGNGGREEGKGKRLLDD